MFVSKKLKVITLACFSFFLSACVIRPGHIQLEKQDNFFMYIKAPSEKVKRQIRFNAQETALAYLPENTKIKLVVTDNDGKHKLIIERVGESIVYEYKLNGRRKNFESEEQQWFSSQIPRIIRYADLI